MAAFTAHDHLIILFISLRDIVMPLSHAFFAAYADARYYLFTPPRVFRAAAITTRLCPPLFFSALRFFAAPPIAAR